MTNRKSIVFFLLAILALLAVEAFLAVGSKRGEPRALSRQTLTDGLDFAERIQIERRGEPSVVLARTSAWQLESPYVGNADEPTVVRLLDKLAFSPVSDAVADSELLKIGRTRADFSLADPLVRVTVSGAGKAEAISLGAPTPSANGVYASVEGVDAVYVVPSDVLTEVGRPADGFRRRAVFRPGVEKATAFDVKRGTGSILSFVRREDVWTTDGQRAAAPRVNAFLTALASAEAVGFVWPTGASNETAQASASLLAGYGLDPESAVTVIVKAADGSDQRVSFGKNADERLVYAFVQGESAIVTLPASLRETALQDRQLFADSRLFPVEPKSVAFFSVAEGDVTCALTREGAGGWRLESPVMAPADSAVAEEVLKRILMLSPADLASSGVSVSISTNAAAVTVSRSSVFGDRAIGQLRSLEMVRIDPLLVKRLSRTQSRPESASVSVAYGRELKVWNVESPADGGRVDEQGVEKLIATLSPLVAERVEKLKVAASDLDDYGLDKPFLTVAVDQDSEEAVRRNVLVGAKTSGGRFATVGSADAVFVISDETVERLSVPLLERATWRSLSRGGVD